MSVYRLKPAFQSLLRPLVGRMAAAGIRANHVTLASAAGSVLVGGLLLLGGASAAFLLVPVWLFLRMALNAMDGMLAREHGQQSDLGAYLNELCDILSDAALMAPFALLAPFGAAWIFALIFLSALTEFAGVLGPMVGATRRYDGPMGKSDRAVVFGALGAWVGCGLSVAPWAAWLMPALAGLLAWTVVNRVCAGLGDVRHRTSSPGTSL